jgi:prolyl-tRNA editing enzyme YbaK/EbsC (Cys-tRNA(Pro) deacylase)
MSLEAVKQHLHGYGLDSRVVELSESSATVELAAQALGTEPRRIAKTLALQLGEATILVVMAGDAKIDNAKYKAAFKAKAKMLDGGQTLERTGHPIGGVCPFGVDGGIQVYLDESLKRFETVFPACGSTNSAIELSLDELALATGSAPWVDVCKGWE